MSKLFKGLKKGLEEGLAHAEGNITLKAKIIEIPTPPAEYSTEDSKST
jgi:putative transcriptional regulator